MNDNTEIYAFDRELSQIVSSYRLEFKELLAKRLSKDKAYSRFILFICTLLLPKSQSRNNDASVTLIQIDSDSVAKYIVNRSMNSKVITIIAGSLLTTEEKVKLEFLKDCLALSKCKYLLFCRDGGRQ